MDGREKVGVSMVKNDRYKLRELKSSNGGRALRRDRALRG